MARRDARARPAGRKAVRHRALRQHAARTAGGRPPRRQLGRALPSAPTAARCSSMACTSCRRRRRPGCCACCSTARSRATARARRAGSTCAWWPRPAPTGRRWSSSGRFRGDLMQPPERVSDPGPPLRGGPMTSNPSPVTCSRSTPRHQKHGGPGSPIAPSTRCAVTPGRGTCASSRTSSSGARSWSPPPGADRRRDLFATRTGHATVSIDSGAPPCRSSAGSAEAIPRRDAAQRHRPRRAERRADRAGGEPGQRQPLRRGALLDITRPQLSYRNQRMQQRADTTRPEENRRWPESTTRGRRRRRPRASIDRARADARRRISSRAR